MIISKCVLLISSFILIIDNVIAEDNMEFTCTLDSVMTLLVKIIFPYPKKPAENAKITLQLFTRTRSRIVIAENGHVNNINYSNFNKTRKSVIIVHGFRGSGETNWVLEMATAYLKYEDVNVIIVDWSIFALTTNYVSAARNTIEVAKQVTDLLNEIIETLGKEIPWQPIHLIGFSLGAHIVGMIPDTFKGKDTWPIARITALDPAAPCFSGGKIALDKTDAPFVDVIHTNGNGQLGITFGMLKAIGHIDFYANGGEFQYGCKRSPFWKFTPLKLLRAFQEAACSHTRAAEYFIESLKIANEGKGWPLTGIQWDLRRSSAIAYTYNGACTTKCIPMGITATKPDDEALMGTYFVPTAHEKPFYEIHDSDREKIVKVLKTTIDAV